MSKHIPPTFIKDLLSRIDIVDIVGQRLTLTKRGQNYLACCPFHDEKTPSFTVSADKQFYHCFGCQVHGNAIGFLMAYDRMEFVESVQYLAQRIGLTLPQADQYVKKDKVQEEDYQVLKKVADSYHQQLLNNQNALAYLKKRGVTEQTIKDFSMGFAPNQWDFLSARLKPKHQLLQQQLLTHGLLIKKDAKIIKTNCFDRFRNRIMFPIRDSRGRVIAFGGRTIGNDEPKYLNSPETPLFHKSNQLYGLYEARQQSSLLRIIIVEGYLDVVMLHQSGITEAVATLGTATNVQHVQLLLRYVDQIIFCFDGDTAGRKAAWKAVTTNLPLLRDGISIRFVFLPEKEDPDSYVRQFGADSFRQLVNQATPLSEVFFTELQRELPPQGIDQKAALAKEALKYLNQMPKGLFRELLMKELATILQVSLDDLEKVQLPITSASAISRVAINTKNIKKTSDLHRLSPAELAIALLVRKPIFAEEIVSEALQQINDFTVQLLLKMVQLFRKGSAQDLGQLMAYLENEETQLAVELASKTLSIPEEGWKAEYQGALVCLEDLANEQIVESLIAAASSRELTPLEKKELHQLLVVKKLHKP